MGPRTRVLRAAPERATPVGAESLGDAQAVERQQGSEGVVLGRGQPGGHHGPPRDPSDDTAIFDLEQVARLPQVADAARTYFEYLFFQVPALISPDNRIGETLGA